jgi:cytochrome P450
MTYTLSFLDLMLNTTGLSASDVAEEVENFMFAGHHSTASVLSWTFYMLVMHPDVQALARQEVNHVGGDGCDDMFVDLNSLTYLDCVIKETMRLFPTVPFYGRHLEEDIEYEDGIVLPKGCEVIISSYCLHRNKDHWTDPHKFDPERFLADRKARHPFSFIPFSGCCHD